MVELGEYLYSPPGLIFIGIITEAEPLPEGRVNVTVCSRFTVFFVSVKIEAIVSRMIENTVEDNVNIPFLSLCYKLLKCSLAAEHTVYLKIVSRVVLMVGVRLEDGAEVDNSNSQRLEIIQLLYNSPEISAEEHIVRQLISVLFGVLHHSPVPVSVQYGIVSLPNLALSLTEAVNEDMVHNSALEPLGRLIFRLVYKKHEATA